METLCLYCANYYRWRTAVASYMGVSVEEAKLGITKVFYGGKPSAELPFLMQLSYRRFDTAYYFNGFFMRRVLFYAAYP